MWNIIGSAYTLASLLWDMGRWVKRQNWREITMKSAKWTYEYFPGIVLFGAMASFVVAMLNVWM